MTATEDAGAFSTANLAQYQAVVWLSTTGDVLNNAQQTAFQAYLASGGGYVGVHAAADIRVRLAVVRRAGWGLLRLTSGDPAGHDSYIGVQNDGAGADINYRNIRIKTGAVTAVDLAQGRPATASSVQAGTPLPAANAVDGDAATRWGSAYSDPQWISVDLGASYAVNRVRLNWEAAYGRAYQIQTSADNAAWTTIYSNTAGDGGIDDLTLAGTGRYLRVYGTQRGLTQYGYSLWDLNVYGTPASATASLLSQGRPTLTSSVENGNVLVGANTVDGNTGSRWGSAYADPQWIAVDLGATRTITRVRITWEAAYARSYQVQTSANNTTWTTVSSTTSGDGGVDDLTVSGTGRYLRVYGTQRALAPYRYSIWELQVFGT